jgi:hypothetical protein
MTPHWAESITAEDKRLYPALAFVRLHQAVNDNLKRLNEPHDSKDLGYVAWLVRNLMELQIWGDFCALSEKNAMEFYEDAARDLIDLNRKGDPADTVLNEELSTIGKSLASDKQTHKYVTASDAADALGKKDAFSAHNKILSKFVHPTAMSVCAPIRGEAATKVMNRFIELGQGLAKECTEALDASFMKPLYDKYEPSIIRVRQENPEQDFVLTR